MLNLLGVSAAFFATRAVLRKRRSAERGGFVLWCVS